MEWWGSSITPYTPTISTLIWQELMTPFSVQTHKYGQIRADPDYSVRTPIAI